MIYALGENKPNIAADAWTAPGSHVMGKVTLLAGASVWFGAVLRGWDKFDQRQKVDRVERVRDHDLFGTGRTALQFRRLKTAG